jgi:hypothetical protein
MGAEPQAVAVTREKFSIMSRIIPKREAILPESRGPVSGRSRSVNEVRLFPMESTCIYFKTETGSRSETGTASDSYEGGRYWTRTSDLHDVNVAL